MNRPAYTSLCAWLAVHAAMAAAALDYSVSWVGNSFSGKEVWVLQDVADIHVEKDGTVFTNVFWDEAGGNVEQIRNGAVEKIAKHTHGWGFEGGDAVASNTKYVYIISYGGNEGGGLVGNSWPPAGFSWSGISRRLRSDIAQAAPFDGGHGLEGDVLRGCYLPVIEVAEGTDASLAGIAATDERLFVSNAYDNTIRGSMTPEQWRRPHPGRSRVRVSCALTTRAVSGCCNDPEPPAAPGACFGITGTACDRPRP